MKPVVSVIPQEQYIACLELPSCKDSIAQSSTDPQQVLRIQHTLRNLQALCRPEEDPTGFHIKRLLERCVHPRTSPPRSVAQVGCTAMAEHIVISMPVTHTQVFWFLSVIAYAWCLLAERGSFLRGGVTTGGLTHTHDLVFGPGLTRASALASAQAHAPRVAIEATLIVGWAPPVRTLLRQDADGVYYLDMFHLPMFLQRRARIHQHIQTGFQATQRDGWNRYHWLVTHMELCAVEQQP